MLTQKLRKKAVNWNELVDEKDKEVWDRLTSSFWLDTKVPLSNDLTTWEKMSDMEKNLTIKVFGGLTMLDTIQATVGAPTLAEDAITPHEEHIMLNIGFMEAVHAKSYSSIFSTLISSREIKDLYQWIDTDEKLNAKVDAILEIYYMEGNDKITKLKKKVASVFLEGFLFYSGFYLPLYWSSRA